MSATLNIKLAKAKTAVARANVEAARAEDFHIQQRAKAAVAEAELVVAQIEEDLVVEANTPPPVSALTPAPAPESPAA